MAPADLPASGRAALRWVRSHPIAIGLLVALTQYVITEGASKIALAQAFIGPADVWLLVPWLVGGVVLIAVLTSLVTLRRYLRV